ncbi:hypothetical protein FB388_3803 [Pseudonocardia cypriaca]|uniref:Uncharacterized protein n=1 Tax=Pseudonocardia cypriaca TaxID=882449 RepID=A0A543FS03_9PSEU|nr:hypothetical protein FB388_3803 [Pseudonocardia cypriaca]
MREGNQMRDTGLLAAPRTQEGRPLGLPAKRA